MKTKTGALALLLLSAFIGFFPLFFSPPQGVSFQAWTLFSIFLFNLVAIILRPLPAGSIAIFALTLAVLTKSLTFAQAASGFQSEVIWLILSAIFFARAFIKTGLGFRIGYHLMALFGKSTLGLGYAIGCTDLLMAPGIPSSTARNGAIVYPVALSIAKTYASETGRALPRLGLFLTQSSFQAGVVTSAMFLTSMAANPLVADFASSFGITLDWVTWFKAGIVPGLASLLVIPPILFYLIKPEIGKTEDGSRIAKEHLLKMGPVSFGEKSLIFVFIMLIVLWIFGKAWFGISATVVALLGLCLLLLLGAIDWDDILHEKSAWDTFIWFSVIVTLTGSLADLGFFKVVTSDLVHHIPLIHPLVTLFVIGVLYFYTHYFFASLVAHIAAMYVPFLALAIALGAPALPSALLLAFFSSLFGGLTHYGSAAAPIFFGAGYATVGEWWKCGIVIGTVNIVIWTLIGGAWWKIIGLF